MDGGACESEGRPQYKLRERTTCNVRARNGDVQMYRKEERDERKTLEEK